MSAPPAKKLKTEKANQSFPSIAASAVAEASGSQPAIGGSKPAIGGSKARPEFPKSPTQPSPDSSPGLWAQYYDLLCQHVLHYLIPALQRDCGLTFDKKLTDLNHVPPSSITENAMPAVGGITNFKETWNIDRCCQALESVGKYEAAGSLWWFGLSDSKVNFMSKTIFDVHPHRSTVVSAKALWGDAAFRASDLTEHRRRFNFPGVLPTACVGIPDAKAKVKSAIGGDAPTFKGLPLLAGRSIVLAYLEAIAECMDSAAPADKHRLKKLYEAMGEFSNSFPIFHVRRHRICVRKINEHEKRREIAFFANKLC